MNAITTTEPARQVTTWKQTLEAAMPSIAASLPAHITPDKFRQVAATAIGSTPGLLQCMKQNPAAVLTALSLCAKDGLLPDNREAALVAFKGDLTYIPMIAGVLKRMRNSGEITSVSSAIVHENDTFDFIQGDEEKLEHRPNWKDDRGEPVAAYAIIRMRSGEIYREVMSRAQIMAVKNASKAKNGPWAGPFELEMWRKTVLKRAAKYCPLSDERIKTMLDRDNELYDLDRVNAPAPSQSKFASLRQPDYRPRFDEAGEVIDAETGEITDNDGDAEPARDVNEDVEEEPESPSEAAAEADADTGADAPDVPETPASEPETGQGGDAEQDQESPMAARLYHETFAALNDPKNRHTVNTILEKAQRHPSWSDLLPSQIKQLSDARDAALAKRGK